VAAALAHIDEEVDLLAEDEVEGQQSRLKRLWVGAGKSRGAEPCIESVATDLVAHFEEHNQAQNGEAMVVAMSCDICLHLYNEIITQRPEWHDEDPLKCDKEGSSHWKITLGFARIR
jgi:type I restriction enzyme R subunit